MPDPSGYSAPLPAGVRFGRGLDSDIDLVHLLVTARVMLARAFKTLRATLRPDALVWVSWLQKSSKYPLTSPRMSSGRSRFRSVGLL